MKREPEQYTKQAQCRLYNFTVIFRKKKQVSATSGHLDDRRYAPGFKRPGKEGWGKEVIFPSVG